MKIIWLKKRCKVVHDRDPLTRRKIRSVFYVDDKVHNEIGPAIIYHGGARSSYYYLNGELEIWPVWKATIWFKKLVKFMFQFRQSHYFLFAILCEMNMLITINKHFWKDTWLFGAGTILMLVMAVLTSKRIPR